MAIKIKGTTVITDTRNVANISDLSISGNATIGGTVDGRDVASDGSKLDGIETGATADQTSAEIKIAYESNANTNAYTDSEKTKLTGIEAGATADQTSAEIKIAYESNANTNAYTDSEKTKLTGIEAGADVTNAAKVTAAGALMDSEVTNLAAVKSFDPANYASSISPTITGTINEDVHDITGTSATLEPDNGSIQTHVLTGNTTYIDGFSSGEAITLMIDDGSAYTITWPTITWVNNAGEAPDLATTGYTVVAIWKVGTILYGALVGDGS